MEREKLISLVQDAQQGKNEALDALFTEFYNDVYYFALKTVKDSDVACDVTQETFVEIIRTIGNLKEPAAFVTWMKRIAYCQCTRYFGKKQDVLVEEDEDGNSIFDTLADESEGSVPSEVLEQEEFRQTILSMINQLTEEQRSAVLLYYFDELSVAQIAQIQGVSEGTVKSRLNYARKGIKKSVEDYEKKHDIKLHSFALLPLLLLFMPKEKMPEDKAKVVYKKVFGASKKVAAAVSTAATTTKISTTAAKAAVSGGLLMKLSSVPIWAKLAAGVVALALIVGGVIIATNQPEPKETGKNKKPTVTTSATASTNGGTTGNSAPATQPGSQPITQPATQATTQPATQPTTTPPSPQPSTPTGEKYTGTNMRPYKLSYEVKDIYNGFCSSSVNMFYRKDGQIATLDGNKLLPNLENATDAEFLWNTDYILYTGEDGKAYIRVTDLVSICKDEIYGELCYIAKQAFEKIHIVSRDDNGDFYYNRFLYNEEFGRLTRLNHSVVNKPFSLNYPLSSLKIGKVDVIRPVVAGGMTHWYIESEGVAYSLHAPSIAEYGGAYYAVPVYVVSGNIEDILELTFNDAGSLLYKKPGDNSNFYYLRYGSSKEHAIKLPAGRTIDQLTRIEFSGITYLFFDDGTVYSGSLLDEDNDTMLTVNEHLTTLNRASAIRDVRSYCDWDGFTGQRTEYDTTLYLWMDDNIVYEYNHTWSIKSI